MLKQNSANGRGVTGKRNSYARNTSYRTMNAKRQPVENRVRAVKISFLGGMNEIGKNMTVFEYDEDMFILDCGLAFPDAQLLGVDFIIPDFSYIEKNASRIKGLIVTHGHEDHIGGIVYLLQKINVPIYSSKLTLGLIKTKLEEHKLLDYARLCEVKAGQTIKLGAFSIEFIHVNHSIPDALGIAINTPAGVIIHTGDFKIDTTPVDGDMIDLQKFAEYGQKGVLALMEDSTNAERPGFAMSEKNVGESFANLFRKAGTKRIVVATFASNIHRVQQIIDVAQQLKRKVAFVGRSLENVVNVGAELGYLKLPKNILISIDEIDSYPDDQLVIITTGSQGEPMSALTKMAYGEHKKVSVSVNDYVIISATPIPGNEKMVSNVVNELMKRGVEVIYEKMYEVHVSGHACQEELKLIMGIVKPKYFIPVHGEQKHLLKNAALAVSMGIKKPNIFVGDNGNSIQISNVGIKKLPDVEKGEIYVDGLSVGDVGNVVINDRKKLSEDGIIIIVATINSETGLIECGPDVVSRGFIYVKENEDLIQVIKDTANEIIESTYDNRYHDWNSVKMKLKDEVSRVMFEKTKRSPMVLPIFMEIV